MRRPLQMLSFLLAASVVAALDAPASLVADCAEPASPYAIRACAAERLLPQIIRWVHLTHSMKQAFDVLRQLRACGLPVHAWP